MARSQVARNYKDQRNHRSLVISGKRLMVASRLVKRRLLGRKNGRSLVSG